MHAVGEAEEESETIIRTKCRKCGQSEDNLANEAA
jgi:hypothetical protein